MATLTPTQLKGRKVHPKETPLPALLTQLGEVLTRQVTLLIDMVIPGASRVYRPTVLLSNDETASTNGSLWIRMPLDFLGLNYPSERVNAAPIWLGLLAHEFGHWLQPLHEMEEVAGELHIPHWLVNILLDIHGEAMVAGLFPALQVPLTATRCHIGRTMVDTYKRDLKKARSFPGALQILSLYFRYCVQPGHSYAGHLPSPRGPAMGLNALTAGRVRSCAEAMGKAADCRAEELPGFLRLLVTQYPELVLSPGEPFGQDGRKDSGQRDGSQDGDAAGYASGGMEHGGASTGSGGEILPALRRMMGTNLPPIPASQAEKTGAVTREFMSMPGGVFPPPLEAVRLANKLTVRFQTPKGKMSVPAPGRLDRIAALHQDPLPFRLDLSSRFSQQPAPKVVLHVDHSGSMGTEKWSQALLAAQAIALAIRRVSGDVRVTLFEGDFYHAEDYSSEALFCRRLSSLSMAKADGNDTSFAWLPIAWMKFPDHIHILLTDGEGELPLLIPERDRKRTCAIVIPDGRPDLIAPVADRVVVVQDLGHLPGVFAFLSPRGWVA